MLLQVPDVEDWTSTFANPSARVNSTSGGSWAVCAPGFKGTVPPGVARLHSPTRYVWVIGRTTMVLGAGDIENVRALQDLYHLSERQSPKAARSTALFQARPAK